MAWRFTWSSILLPYLHPVSATLTGTSHSLHVSAGTSGPETFLVAGVLEVCTDTAGGQSRPAACCFLRVDVSGRDLSTSLPPAVPGNFLFLLSLCGRLVKPAHELQPVPTDRKHTVHTYKYLSIWVVLEPPSSTLGPCSLSPCDWLPAQWADQQQSKHCHRLCHSVPAPVDCLSSHQPQVRYPSQPLRPAAMKKTPVLIAVVMVMCVTMSVSPRPDVRPQKDFNLQRVRHTHTHTMSVL